MSEIQVLRLLYNYGTLSRKELISKMDIAESTFYRQRKNLVRRGLIEVVLKVKPARKTHYLFNITNEGERHLKSIGLIKEVN